MYRFLLSLFSFGSLSLAAVPTPLVHKTFDEQSTPGAVGNAIYFNSTTSVDSVLNPSNQITDGTWSITFWAKIESINSKYGIYAFGTSDMGVTANADRKDEFGIKLAVDINENSQLGAGVTEFGVKDHDDDGGTMRLNEWMNVLMTYQNSTFTVYVDGVQDAQYTFSKDKQNFTLHYGVGAIENDQGAYYLDDIQLFDEVLTAAQAQELFTNNGGVSIKENEVADLLSKVNIEKAKADSLLSELQNIQSQIDTATTSVEEIDNWYNSAQTMQNSINVASEQANLHATNAENIANSISSAQASSNAQIAKDNATSIGNAISTSSTILSDIFNARSYIGGKATSLDIFMANEYKNKHLVSGIITLPQNAKGVKLYDLNGSLVAEYGNNTQRISLPTNKTFIAHFIY